ncbi:MAG: DUF1772 domain-containing protein [Anaerolineae bacterium]|nr:DUF1772 domain-containing protein [Anaerolineae bacterium]
MRFTIIENGLVAVATIVFGIMAGFFWTYTFNVNLAMLQVDSETYATVQSLFNQNVRHFMFFIFFFGGGFFSVLALLGNWRQWKSVSFWLLAVACVVYIFGIIVFTAQVNLPLNYYTESWNPQQVPADWMSIREQWNQANAIRVGTSALAFVLSLSTLVIRASTPQ